MYQKYKSAELVKPSGLDLKDRLVGVQRVTKVTKGGRAFGFSAIVVVGDEAGVVGHGLGKSKDVSTAIAKAIELLINHDNLREKIISNGYDLSKSNSLKMQTKKLANLISQLTFKKNI